MYYSSVLPSKYNIVVGDWSLKDTDPGEEIFEADTFIPHPSYAG